MTSALERQIRKLEAQHTQPGFSVLILGIPRQAEPSTDEISRASLILRINFVAAKNGRPVDGE
jgi:hypothetical protein